jgi:hypothetical protein
MASAMRGFVKWKSRVYILVAVIVLGGAFGCRPRQSRHPQHYLIPDGFIGRLRVYYHVPGAPPLPLEDGHWILKFSDCGYLITSTPAEIGWASDRYYYDGPGGLRELTIFDPKSPVSVWDAGNDFFIGTEEQSKRFVGSDRVGPFRNTDQKLTGQQLSYVNLTTLPRESRRDFVGADLTAAKGRGAELSGANFTDATLQFADLSDARLQRAKLLRADLLQAYVKRADLRGADLREAQLEAADLRGANLSGANLRGATFDRHTNWPKGFDPVRAGARLVCEQPASQAPEQIGKARK